MCVHEWSFTRHVHLLFKVQVDGVTMDLEFWNACKNVATQLKNGFRFIIYLQFKPKYMYIKYIQLKAH